MNSNHKTLVRFYEAFRQENAAVMASCYHAEASFSDPVFGNLNHHEVISMWEMLLKRSKGNLLIEFEDIEATEIYGKAKWIATYEFSQTKRKVINTIQANFEFKEGLIFKHTDTFNLWKWSGMALGWKGYLLGWTPFFKAKIREKARKSLATFIENLD